MHIIAGRFKGIAIPPALKGTRPTTDRTKEAIFSYLSARGYLEEARILDLYAGTGALGFEALSRGAKELVAVESSRRAAALIQETASKIKASSAWHKDEQIQVCPIKVERYIMGHIQAFDLVFIDPPYAMESTDCDQLFIDLSTHGGVQRGTLVVLERSVRSPQPNLPGDWKVVDNKTYGETAVYYCEKE